MLLKSWAGWCTSKGHDKVCTRNWIEQMRDFIQYACQIFLLDVFSPSHRLGSISVKLCWDMCSYTELVNEQKRKMERGREMERAKARAKARARARKEMYI